MWAWLGHCAGCMAGLLVQCLRYKVHGFTDRLFWVRKGITTCYMTCTRYDGLHVTRFAYVAIKWLQTAVKCRFAAYGYELLSNCRLREYEESLTGHLLPVKLDWVSGATLAPQQPRLKAS